LIVEQWIEYNALVYGITGSVKGEKTHSGTVQAKVFKIFKYKKTEGSVWASC